MDGYSQNMTNHATNCYQAGGFSKSGAEQLANNQPPTSPADQAMFKAFSTPNQQWQQASAPEYTNNAKSAPEYTNNWGGSGQTADQLGTPPTQSRPDLLASSNQSVGDTGATASEAAKQKLSALVW